SSAPVLIPIMTSCVVRDGVTETVVPGHTRTCPPRASCSTAVSLPAVNEDPETILRLPASTTAPDPLVTGTAAGAVPRSRPGTLGICAGGVLLAFTSSGGFNRTINRLPAPSQV